MSPEQLRAWEKLQLVGDALRREVGRDLWRDARLSDAEFTVLAQLHSAEADGVRPSECARAIGWDTSRLAHQVRRLEKRGLVVTRPGTGTDARATSLTLTADGTSAYRRAIGPHLRSAREWFADALTPDELAGLDHALDRILDHVDQRARSTGASTKGQR